MAQLYSSFNFTKAGFIIPTITGSMSCLSSLTIIAFILRSKSNTIYHRIMFGLSFADIIASLAIALTTLPMPKDVIYPFSGPSYGTIETCEAQGFMYIIGSCLAFCMMAALNVYYACTLSFNVREEVFRRCIEPVIYVISIAASVISPIVLLLKADMLNPGVNDPFCVPAIYPEGCNKEDDPDCRGTPSGSRYHLLGFIFAFTLGFVTLIVTMGSIIYTFYKREKRVKEKLKSSTETTDEDESKAKELENAQKMTRIISKQALMYIGAFVVTWIIPMLTVVDAIGALYWVQVLRMIFQPSQGFFNMLIFFYHKVNIIQRIDEDRTVGDALRILFKSPRESPEVVLVYNIEDVVYKDFALPKIISPINKLIIVSNDHADAKDSAAESQINADNFLKPQVDMFVSRGGDYDSTTSEKNCKAQLACESVKLHHDLSFASQSLGGCSTVMQEGLPHVLPIDEENYGTGNATRCRANELESYGSHSLQNGRSNGDVELLSYGSKSLEDLSPISKLNNEAVQ
jgi:hypothetical protein